MALTQEDFDETVFEFAKAITTTCQNSNGTTLGLAQRKLILNHARGLAVAWYQDADARKEAFQQLISEETAEPKKQSYATAGKTIF